MHNKYNIYYYDHKQKFIELKNAIEKIKQIHNIDVEIITVDNPLPNGWSSKVDIIIYHGAPNLRTIVEFRNFINDVNWPKQKLTKNTIFIEISSEQLSRQNKCIAVQGKKRYHLSAINYGEWKKNKTESDHINLINALLDTNLIDALCEIDEVKKKNLINIIKSDKEKSDAWRILQEVFDPPPPSQDVLAALFLICSIAQIDIKNSGNQYKKITVDDWKCGINASIVEDLPLSEWERDLINKESAIHKLIRSIFNENTVPEQQLIKNAKIAFDNNYPFGKNQ